MVNITPNTPGEYNLIRDYTSEKHGVRILGLAHKCDAATEDAGTDRYHVVVEFWDNSNPNEPEFVMFQAAHSDHEDGHFNLLEATEKAIELVEHLGPGAEHLPSEPGAYVTALRLMEAEREAEAQAMARIAMVLMQAAIEAAGEDDNEPLPGAFAGFNPFN